MTTLAASLLVLTVGLQSQAAKPAFGTCERLGAAVVGEQLVKPPSKQFPRKRTHVNPTFPELPEGSAASGMWVGEALVLADGTVARVWPLREPRVVPAFPAFNQSIVDAIMRWAYDPWVQKGRATPFCVAITVNIDY